MRPSRGLGYLQFNKTGLQMNLPGNMETESGDIVYDAGLDWSITRGNPNGAWTYGEMTIGFGSFARYVITDTDVLDTWQNGTVFPDIYPQIGLGNYYTQTHANYNGPIGTLLLHPGPATEPSVLRWTAPRNFSSLVITGQFLTGASDSPSISVRFRNEAIFAGINAGAFNLRLLNVSRLESVDFCVYGGSFNFGTTPLEAHIVATP